MNKWKWLGAGLAFGLSLAAMLFIMFAVFSGLPLEPTKGQGQGHTHHHRQPKYSNR